MFYRRFPFFTYRQSLPASVTVRPATTAGASAVKTASATDVASTTEIAAAWSTTEVAPTAEAAAGRHASNYPTASEAATDLSAYDKAGPTPNKGTEARTANKGWASTKAVEPRTSTYKDAAREVARAVVAIGRAAIRVISVIAIGACGRWTDIHLLAIAWIAIGLITIILIVVGWIIVSRIVVLVAVGWTIVRSISIGLTCVAWGNSAVGAIILCVCVRYCCQTNAANAE